MTASSLRCAACGAELSSPPLRFSCPNRGQDGADHLLEASPPALADVAIDHGERNPFLRYRTLSYAWRLARARGISDDGFVALVRALDAAVAEVDGHGFAVTPTSPSAELARALGIANAWIKDETGNVSGSHKARHLFGLAVLHAIAARDDSAPWAIASCGNAALAAAVVARAARHPLRVFVPPWAEAPVVARLRALGAELTECPRRADDPPGDPCHHRFREAVAAGAVPFSCQGSDNGLTIDGGMTLGFELADALPKTSARLFVQVGGGALASSVAQGLEWMHQLTGAPSPPMLHAVQTAGCFPLLRAWRRLARDLCAELGAERRPADDLAVGPEATSADAAAASAIAAADPKAKAHALARAIAERSRYMWPWEHEPKSAASGILDDETYDYAAILRALLATGGFPIVATEEDVRAAHTLARTTALTPSATGSAGLAGALTLRDAGLLLPADTALLLFTGIER